MRIRSPIIAVLGHVDHGKTSLLDAVRGTCIAKKEAGGITQMIGASYIRKENIDEISKSIAKKMTMHLHIPGILFIDTPGHAAFVNLRERGGSIADMAVLVVDIAQGFQPQTIESLKILKNAKTPFLIAANKIDLITGWKTQNTNSFLESFAKQSEHVKSNLNNKIYELIGALSEYNFDSERFDRVADFTKQLGIVPLSAKTHEGIAEILLLIAGLSQKFLENELHFHSDKGAKGSIIEVKDERGLGPTINIIIYDGILSEGEEILFLGKHGVKKTKIRALLEPSLDGAKEKFMRVKQIAAAAGIKILAPNLEDALSGSPFVAIKDHKDYEKNKKEIEAQVSKLIFENSGLGAIIKADSLGSIEAILKILTDEKIPIKTANVGAVTKNDVFIAANVGAQDKYTGIVFAFNVQILPDARTACRETNIPIIYSNIIYKLVDNYNEWKSEEKEKEKKEVFEKMPWPCAIKVLPNCFFRMSKPAIFGIEVLAGRLKPHFKIMNKNGVVLGEIKTIQREKEALNIAEKGLQTAISIDEVTLNNDVFQEDILITYMTKNELEKWKKKIELLSQEEKEILLQIERLVSSFNI
ncbi:MAG: translation initiation factor IF-2 [Candidatus Micrarchaeota archaeon]